MNPTYLKYELLRLTRNRQNFIFSLIFPIVLFYAIGGSNQHTEVSPGLSFPTYYLAGMIAFGTLAAVTSGGARIAMERDVGWNRQLRITPLRPSTYLSTKVLLAYLMAAISFVLLSLAGLSIGVHIGLLNWLETAVLVLIALIPFAALGVAIGHLVKGDSIGPIMGGGISFFSLLGGAYFPWGDHGAMHDIVQLIPSYWLVQAGQSYVGGQSWTVEAWVVVFAWAVAFGALAVWAYRRDTLRP
jgi:ABC-2 type transport system permease protein